MNHCNTDGSREELQSEIRSAISAAKRMRPGSTIPESWSESEAWPDFKAALRACGMRVEYATDGYMQVVRL